jgi:hypothetical protein
MRLSLSRMVLVMFQNCSHLIEITCQAFMFFGVGIFITHISYDIGIKQAFPVILTAVVVTTSFGPD